MNSVGGAEFVYDLNDGWLAIRSSRTFNSLFEVPLRECPARPWFEVTLEANGAATADVKPAASW